MRTATGEPHAIGLDIGGTKIAGGVVTAGGVVLERTRVPTPPADEAATLAAMVAVVDELRARHPRVDAVGVGAAGMVEWPRGRLRWAPHNAYRRLELRRLLHERTGLPTVVDNDATAAAWAEARFGAGAGTDDLVLVAVGTGIGGGLVLGGKVYRGATGAAGELGHTLVGVDASQGVPPSLEFPQRGALESLASGRILDHLAAKIAADNPSSALGKLAARGREVDGHDAVMAAKGGDPEAIEAVRTLAPL